MESEILYTAHKSLWSITRYVVGMIVLMTSGYIIMGALSDIGALSERWLIGIGAALIVIGILVIVLMCLAISKYEIRFYKDRIIIHQGIINVREDQSILTPIVGVSLKQSWWQKIFNAGDIIIDKVGKGWDIDTTWIRDPIGLKKYLESLIDSTDYRNVGQFIAQ